jgi:mannosyltransferase
MFGFMDLYYDNIVYDLQNVGGISSYWYELTKRLLGSEQVRMKFYETSFENNNILREQLDLRNLPIARSASGIRLVERFRRLNDWDFEQPGIFHSSYFRVPVKRKNIRIVTTIHDFTHDFFFKGPRVWLHNFAKRRAILESDAIITISEHTKRDLIRFYPEIDKNKVRVIYNGVSDDFKKDTSAAQPADLSLLYVGARDAYKNFRFAVQIAATQPEAYLDIVGAALSPVESMYLDSQMKGRYRVHTHISTPDLNKLYNQAACLLYPSSYEGFGIPLLEAMRAGCPFIALNGSSIPEVAGDAGYLLRSLDLDAAREALIDIIAFRAIYAEKGYSQSDRFSWDKCCNETFQLYQNLI